jgi:hypothetical protein
VTLGVKLDIIGIVCVISTDHNKMMRGILLLILLQTSSGQPQLTFGIVNPITGQLEAMTSPSFDYFEAVETQVKRLVKERLRREAGSERQARRYVIYEKQPEVKEKKKKVSWQNFNSCSFMTSCWRLGYYG